jgi:hypothetical protein
VHVLIVLLLLRHRGHVCSLSPLPFRRADR